MQVRRGTLNQIPVTYISQPISDRKKVSQDGVASTFRQALGKIISAHPGLPVKPPDRFCEWIAEMLDPVITGFYMDVLERGRFLDWFQFQVALKHGGVVVLIGAVPILDREGYISKGRELIIGFLHFGTIRSFEEIRWELLWQPYSPPSFCVEDKKTIMGLLQATNHHIQSILLSALANGGSLIVKSIDGQEPASTGSGKVADLKRKIFYVDDFSTIFLTKKDPLYQITIAHSQPLGQIRQIYVRALKIRSFYRVHGFVGMWGIEKFLCP